MKKKRQQIFRKTFGYFDKSTYEMMTSRFGKLFEFYKQPQVKKLMKEQLRLETFSMVVICLMKVCMTFLVH